MGYIDFILNLAGLLLWLNWRSAGLSAPPPALTLASTLKRTEAEPGNRWLFLAGLPSVLLVRSLLYWQMAPALDWTPNLSFGAIVVSFRVDMLGRAFLYSFLSFGLMLGAFFSWICLVSAVNHRMEETDSCQRLIQLHLGWLGRLPALVQLLVPFLVASLLWLLAGSLFVRLGMMPAPQGLGHTLQQSLVIGGSLVLAWKYLLAGLFVLHFLNSYVYLGGAPFWNFITVTGRNLLYPLSWCRFGKLDLAPVLGIALVIGLGEAGEYWLPELYRRLPL
jgi:hypothetical protein